jgi:DNA-binding MarR family transcriptional regulator
MSENIEADWGISGPSLLVMGLLSRTGSMTMGQTADALDLTPGAVTRIVKGLEKAGLVERTENPDDRRESIVTLTAIAKSKAATLVPMQDERVAKAFQELTDEEIVEYIRVTFKLANSLRSRRRKR